VQDRRARCRRVRRRSAFISVRSRRQHLSGATYLGNNTDSKLSSSKKPQPRLRTDQSRPQTPYSFRKDLRRERVALVGPLNASGWVLRISYRNRRETTHLANVSIKNKVDGTPGHLRSRFRLYVFGWTGRYAAQQDHAYALHWKYVPTPVPLGRRRSHASRTRPPVAEIHQRDSRGRRPSATSSYSRPACGRA